MGLLDIIKTVIINKYSTKSVLKLLNGKIDVKSLAIIFATYLIHSKLTSSSSAAKNQGNSFAQQIASVINLGQCKGIADVISKLVASDKQGAGDLANKLSQAVNFIRSLSNKA